MRILVVEDDATSRTLLTEFVRPFGAVDAFERPSEGIASFRKALEAKQPYGLVCLDIMLPEADGHLVLETIRNLEAQHGIRFKDGVRVIMTTALGDSTNVMKAFREQCEGYLVKPFTRAELIKLMKELGIPPQK